MAVSPPGNEYSATPPFEVIQGENNSVLMVMSGLGSKPASGRLLRGLAPFLDEHDADHVILLAERQRRERWRPDEPVVHYQELVHWARGVDSNLYRGVCIKGEPLRQEEITQAFTRDPLGVVEWAARRSEAAVIFSGEPLLLTPCIVEKPWGREVWFTGIEERGVALVHSTTGTTELPYALGMFPVPLVGEEEQPPILLKVLQPHPDPGLGDLYLEVHKEKWEAYIVQQVDSEAWPDEKGCMLAGLDAQVAARYRDEHGDSWESHLESDLGATIGAYENVRREIDSLLDQALLEDGSDPARPPELETLRRLRAGLPENLRERERQSREAVEAILGKVPLVPGDVAILPPGTLHSLRHGVQVVEFQTPTYERLIALSSQKVLTQSQWDTREALALMNKTVYAPPPVVPIQDDAGGVVERVVSFPEFEVQRLRINQGAMRRETTGGENFYHLLYVLSGEGMLRLPAGGSFKLTAGSALLLGAYMGAYELHAAPHAALTCLRSVSSVREG